MNASAKPKEWTEPRSYLSEEERQELAPNDDVNFYEMCAAKKAGDLESVWGWMARTQFHDSTKQIIKRFGEGFLSERGIAL